MRLVARHLSLFLLLATLALGCVAAPDARAAEGGASAAADNAPRAQRMAIGYLEEVAIFPGNLRLKAKIDTGANSSSLDALNIQPFRDGDADWVRFFVAGDAEEVWRFKLPVVRIVRIKRAGAPTIRRYVVEMSVCLGPVLKKTEVNLINRSGMNYRMLVGRMFMAGDFVVDPTLAFRTRPTCDAR